MSNSSPHSISSSSCEKMRFSSSSITSEFVSSLVWPNSIIGALKKERAETGRGGGGVWLRKRTAVHLLLDARHVVLELAEAPVTHFHVVLELLDAQELLVFLSRQQRVVVLERADDLLVVRHAHNTLHKRMKAARENVSEEGSTGGGKLRDCSPLSACEGAP